MITGPDEYNVDNFRVLVATPYRHNTAEGFIRRSTQIYDSLTFKNKSRAPYANNIERPEGASKYWPNARARNDLIDLWLTPSYTHVFWIDVDIVECPPDIIEQLLSISTNPLRAIVAPMVLIEGTDHFYDIGGFNHQRQWFSARPPYCTGGQILRLTSVGSCYIAPTWIYTELGLRYSSDSDRQIEHVPVMDGAMLAGCGIFAARFIKVEHAHLPKWHQEWH